MCLSGSHPPPMPKRLYNPRVDKYFVSLGEWDRGHHCNKQFNYYRKGKCLVRLDSQKCKNMGGKAYKKVWGNLTGCALPPATSFQFKNGKAIRSRIKISKKRRKKVAAVVNNAVNAVVKKKIFGVIKNAAAVNNAVNTAVKKKVFNIVKRKVGQVAAAAIGPKRKNSAETISDNEMAPVIAAAVKPAVAKAIAPIIKRTHDMRMGIVAKVLKPEKKRTHNMRMGII